MLLGAKPIAWTMMSALAPGEFCLHDSKKEAVEPSTLTSIGCNSVPSGSVATNCCILLLNLGWKPKNKGAPCLCESLAYCIGDTIFGTTPKTSAFLPSSFMMESLTRIDRKKHMERGY